MCHMGSHSVTWHPAEVTIPHLRQLIKAGTRFSDPAGMQGWVDLVGLVTYQGGIPAKLLMNTIIAGFEEGWNLVWQVEMLIKDEKEEVSCRVREDLCASASCWHTHTHTHLYATHQTKAIIASRLRPSLCRIMMNSIKHKLSCLTFNIRWTLSKYNVMPYSDTLAPYAMKTWCHPQNWKYLTYRNAVRRGPTHLDPQVTCTKIWWRSAL